MNIAVCDDNRQCREDITTLLTMYSEKNPQYEIAFFVFSNADDLISAAARNGGFDIYLLNVTMPETNGIELGIKLRSNYFDGKIIYLSHSEEFVFETFKAQPFNYIIKPVSCSVLFPILDSAINTLNYKKEKSIIVKTSEGSVKLSHSSIMYAELIRNIVYHLTNGRTVETTTIRTSFSDAVKDLLREKSFVLCGASFLVNMLHITKSGTNELFFRNGSLLKLSRKLLKEFRGKWYEYWTGEREEDI